MAVTTKAGVAHTEKSQETAFFASNERRFPSLRIADSGKVRLGAQGPVFRPTTDAGKVRLGAQGPVFRGAAIADAGKVRLGAQGPIFR